MQALQRSEGLRTNGKRLVLFTQVANVNWSKKRYAFPGFRCDEGHTRCSRLHAFYPHCTAEWYERENQPFLQDVFALPLGSHYNVVMSRLPLRRTLFADDAPTTAQAPNGGSSSLDWEFGDLFPAEVIDLTPQLRSQEARTQFEQGRTTGSLGNGQPGSRGAKVRSSSPLAERFRGPQAAARLATLVDTLDAALDRWWSDNQLPDARVLRDALLALEAGHNLDEGHRTLLLRTALYLRKGLLTALRYQTDPDRTAFVLKESLLDVWHPLPPDVLWRLQQDDPANERWTSALLPELRDELVLATGVQQMLAARAIAVLSGEQPPAGEQAPRLLLRPGLPANNQPAWRRYWSPGRAVLLLLAVAALLLLFQQARAIRPAGMVIIPGGTYALGVAASGAALRSVTLKPFAIDQYEVTINNYRQCVAVGVCLAPLTVASATRPDYYTNPTFALYPMVNLSQSAAAQFCGWLGKRLPTDQEWEIAAGYSPATGRQSRYPWGDLYDRQLANVAEAALGDTRPVGTFQPYGNTPTGLADMAGNVAEWTESPAGDDNSRVIVKGGSYLDGAQAVQVSAKAAVPPDDAAPWLGFRCAADQPD
jgi:formylglycine-generating enzyme required for sulfatase activity